MTELTVIRRAAHCHAHGGHHSHVRLSASRTTLAKRRWRGVAEDGREFGFDLDEALSHGAHFFAEGSTHYVLDQSPEEVLEIPVTTLEEAARVAWNLGNLHFGVQVLPTVVRVTEDPAVLQFLSREKIAFKKVNCVFQPLSAGAHHHQHGHPHG
jgi:urease accessory protein